MSNYITHEISYVITYPSPNLGESLSLKWLQSSKNTVPSFFINKLRPRQDDRHLKTAFANTLNENIWISLIISLKFNHNMPPLVQIMAMYRSDNKPLNHRRYCSFLCVWHDDVIKWKHFPRNWPFVRKIHRSPVNFPHKGQWRGALMFSLIYVWINDWANNREAGDLRRQHGHYDVIVMVNLWVNEASFQETRDRSTILKIFMTLKRVPFTIFAEMYWLAGMVIQFHNERLELLNHKKHGNSFLTVTNVWLVTYFCDCWIQYRSVCIFLERYV